jgi:hypothetical protein
MTPVMIYAPPLDKHYRVTWYGGESTQLHFEKRVTGLDANDEFTSEWVDMDVFTLEYDMPTSTKELYQKMKEHYDRGLELEIERAHQYI